MMDGQAITFDFHNTLAVCPAWFELEVRTLPSALLRWRARRRGIDVAAETLHEADRRYRDLRRAIMEHGNELDAETGLAQVFAAMRLHVPAEDIAAGVAALMRDALSGATPAPGAVETIRALHGSGATLGVVSSAVYHPFLEWTLAAFGVRDAFQTVVTSASAGFYKSRPEIYVHATAELGANPRRSVHVGDSLRYDVGGAKRAGMGAIWLRWHGAAYDDAAIVPDLTIETLVASAPAILTLLEARDALLRDAHP